MKKLHAGSSLGENDLYIERSADDELLQSLISKDNNELCLILAPRQTGKTSLIHHILPKLKDKKINALKISCEFLGSEKNIDDFFQHLIMEINFRLKLKKDLIQWKEKKLSAQQNFIHYLEKILSNNEDQIDRLIIFIDEIDTIYDLPFSDEFFITIRQIFNERVINPPFQKLSFVLIGVVPISSMIKNTNRTPFNIGKVIELADFNKKNIKQILQQEYNYFDDQTIDDIFHWTDGQPYLTQLFLIQAFEWTKDNKSIQYNQLNEYITNSFLNQNLKKNAHLSHIQEYILKNKKIGQQTIAIYSQLLNGKKIIYNEKSKSHENLKYSGIVRITDDQLCIRNNLYKKVFDNQWVKTHLKSKNYIWIIFAIVIANVLFLLIPSFFPEFPDYLTIDKKTDKPSIQFDLSLSNDITEVYLNDEKLRLHNKLHININKLPIGESAHVLRMHGGFLGLFQHIIHINISYYPGWYIKQFPDNSWNSISPILLIDDNEITVKDIQFGIYEYRQFEHNKTITYYCMSPSRKFFATGDESGSLKLWIWNGEQVWLKKEIKAHKSSIKYIAFTFDEKRVISAGKDHLFKIWDFAKGTKVETLYDYQDNVFMLSPDNKHYVSGGSYKHLAALKYGQIFKRRVKLYSKKNMYNTLHCSMEYNWDLEHSVLNVSFHPEKKNNFQLNMSEKFFDLPIIHVFNEKNIDINCLKLTKDGQKCVTGGKNNEISLWNINKGQLIKSFLGHNGGVNRIIFSKGERFILSGGNDNLVKLWNIDNGNLIQTYSGLMRPVQAISISDDNKLVYAKDDWNAYIIWETETGTEITSSILGHSSAVINVLFSDNGKKIISSDVDGVIKFWDTRSGMLVGTIEKNESNAKRGKLIFTRYGNQLIATGFQQLYLYDMNTLKKVDTIKLKTSNILDQIISSDGKKIICADENGIEQIDLQTKVKKYINIDGKKIKNLKFFNNGKNIVSWAFDNRFTLWNIIDNSIENQQQFIGHKNMISDIACSPDKKMLASSSFDGKVILWDIKTGKQIHTFHEYNTLILCVAFSPEGKYLIYGSSDHTLTLWNIELMSMEKEFNGHQADIKCVSFSADGKWIISGSADRTLRLWWAGTE